MARRHARAAVVAKMKRMRFRAEPAALAAALEAVDGAWWHRTGRTGLCALKDIRHILHDFEPHWGQSCEEALALQLEMEAKTAWTRWGNRATAIRECGEFVKVLRCKGCVSDKAYVLVPEWCLSRYCPTCCKINRCRTQARLRTILGRFKNSPRFLTLTVASGHDLQETRRRLWEAWAKFRRRAWVRRLMHGGFAVLEVTYSEERGWHPHLHIAFDGYYLPWARMVDEWMSCCGCSCSRPRDRHDPVLCCKAKWKDDDRFHQCSGCDCAGAGAGPAGQFVKALSTAQAVRQLGKYCAKELGEASPNLPRERLIEFLRLTWGRRTLSTFGTHYDPALEAEDEEIALRALRDIIEPNDLKCPLCGSTELRQTGIRAVERAPP